MSLTSSSLLRAPVVVDVETTILMKGNPFVPANRLCYIGVYPLQGRPYVFPVWGLEKAYLPEVQALLDEASCLVAFNAKFDCHWMERVGYRIEHLRLWDCQYAEFIRDSQQNRFPSLQGACERYGVPGKVDGPKDFWDRGIDTPDIDPDLMKTYLFGDLEATARVFQAQVQWFQDQTLLFRLFLLHMEDQVVLRTMERNGILYETEKSLALAEGLADEIRKLDAQLLVGYETVPINFDSPAHVSAYLFGGTFKVETRVPIGIYKTGAKAGQVRNKVVEHEYKLPRIIEPLPGSELAKDGQYSTAEDVLKVLRGTKDAKRRIGLLDQRSKLQKLHGTYYAGFPKKLKQMGWSDDYLHPTLNQCVTVTGRLSSTSPNGQNQPPESKRLCISRYEPNLPDL